MSFQIPLLLGFLMNEIKGIEQGRAVHAAILRPDSNPILTNLNFPESSN